MQKSKFKILALTAALIMPLSSCKETIIYVTPEDTPNDDIKTPIELSVGGVDGAVESSSTRAVITDDNTKTYNPFDKDTKIFMVMKSTYGTEDYQGSKKDKYTVSKGVVEKDQSAITFDNVNQKYWDDAHARSSELDIWAFAQQSPDNWHSYTFQIPDNNWEGIDTDPNRQKEYKGFTYNDQTSYGWIEHDYNNGSGDKGSKGAIYPCIMNWYASHYIESTYGENQYKQDANSVQYQDLMFSNNLTKHGDGTENDKRLKFGTKTAGKFDTGEMKFYHAMSKLTIQIIEGDGFDKSSTNKANDFKFASGKNVKLTNFNMKGTFNIKDGEFQQVESLTVPHIALSTSTSETGVSPNIETTTIYTLQALAVPNINDFLSQYSASDTKSRFVSSDTDANNIMMEFTIDNNTYKITSKQLYDALLGKAGATETTTGIIPLEAGKNYIFTFVVGKTKIEHLTATVADWEDVVANEYTPIIDVNQDYGEKGSGENDFDKTYTLLRSTTKAGSYGNGSCSDGNSAKMEYDATANNYKAMAPQLYWPDHKTHYFFRGIYPEVKTTTGHPTIDSDGKTISVTNSAYSKGTSPSDLMIGIPRKADGTPDEKCKVTGTNHGSSVEGICATSGTINLNFRYAMSQVEVRLTTTTGNAAVNLTNAKVEVVGGYKQGKIKLEDGSVATFTASDKGDFELASLPTTDNNKRKDKDGNENILSTNVRHSSVIPQDLTYDSSKPLDASNLRFKITITNTDGSTDVYYADIKPIEVTVGSNNKSTITKWEAGKHYIYFLELKKTDIKVSATITDWVTATGSTNVWF